MLTCDVLIEGEHGVRQDAFEAIQDLLREASRPLGTQRDVSPGQCMTQGRKQRGKDSTLRRASKQVLRETGLLGSRDYAIWGYCGVKDAG